MALVPFVMLRSMTGFGAAHRNHGARVLSVEARSVNHRYCDVRFSVPRELESLVQGLESFVRKRVRRGRVDVTVTIGVAADAALEPVIDLSRAAAYQRVYQQLAEHLQVPADVPLTTIAQWPGVLRAPEVRFDAEHDQAAVEAALAEALDGLAQMRLDEGRRLRTMLFAHLEKVAELRSSIRALIPQALEERAVRLRKRIDELLGDKVVDESRIAQEVAMLADRADVTEEMERLDSHIVQFERLLEEDDVVGRKLDFMLQEMNREANTLGSKCNHAEVAHLVVDLKAELERMREQVQNVE